MITTIVTTLRAGLAPLRRLCAPVGCALLLGTAAAPLRAERETGAITGAVPGATTELAGVRFDGAVQVGGRRLVLNGAGVGRQLFFRVYVIGLYLQDRRDSTAAILGNEAPRRVVVTMLRDVDGATFGQAVAGQTALREPRVEGQLAQLVRAILRQPQGLKRGDVLTLDWLPDAGTLIELNGRRLLPAVPGVAFHNALLDIWLGDDPADPALKPQLLGRPPGWQAALAPSSFARTSVTPGYGGPPL